MSPVVEATGQEARLAIEAWFEQFVIGLNLCPFARPLRAGKALRVAVCEGAEPALWRRAFLAELDLLQGSSEDSIATTLLVFSRGLADFETYLDLLADASDLVQAAGLEGEVQLASFHPRYRFQGEPANSVSHFTNRAPYPVIHLLRESMVTRALAVYPHPDQIPENNIRTLAALGRAEVLRRWQALLPGGPR